MLTPEMKDILLQSKEHGWIIEPLAKKLLGLAGLPTTEYLWAKDPAQALAFASKVRYPVVAKVVSPTIIHKSEVSGVVVGINNDKDLSETFDRLNSIESAQGVLVEGAVKGVELIIGAKIDGQFGPVIVFGAGGTAVEVYQDVAIRMAPLTERDAFSMMDSLKARKFLEGYRGAPGVNKGELADLLVRFSNFVMDIADAMESIDLNPVICSAAQCTIADARIMLKAV